MINTDTESKKIAQPNEISINVIINEPVKNPSSDRASSKSLFDHEIL